MKLLKTCLFSLNNPVDIHPSPVPVPKCVDNATVIHTVFYRFINTFAERRQPHCERPQTAVQKAANRTPKGGKP